MERLSDTAINIINDLHTERLDYTSEYLPLIDALNRLAEYENAEAEGRLVMLPCKVGDILYVTEPRYYNGRLHTGVQRGEVYGFELDEKWLVWVRLDDDAPYSKNAYSFADFGKTIFLAKEEAEQALKGKSE